MAESPVATEQNKDDIQLAAPTPENAVAQTDEQQQQLEPAKKKKVIVRRKKRPARAQVDPSIVKAEPPPQTGTTWNIWYSVWSGGDRDTDKYGLNTPAPGRCVVSRDSGYTRADRVVGSFFCLYFARGICHRGADCDYLHRIPTIHDIFQPNVDCFGRDKHASFRDDMGGTGSFNRVNKTLYVGRVHVSDDIEEVVSRHFQEWGEIERIRVLTVCSFLLGYRHVWNTDFGNREEEWPLSRTLTRRTLNLPCRRCLIKVWTMVGLLRP